MKTEETVMLITIVVAVVIGSIVISIKKVELEAQSDYLERWLNHQEHAVVYCPPNMNLEKIDFSFSFFMWYQEARATKIDVYRSGTVFCYYSQYEDRVKLHWFDLKDHFGDIRNKIGYVV